MEFSAEHYWTELKKRMPSAQGHQSQEMRTGAWKLLFSLSDDCSTSKVLCAVCLRAALTPLVGVPPAAAPSKSLGPELFSKPLEKFAEACLQTQSGE